MTAIIIGPLECTCTGGANRKWHLERGLEECEQSREKRRAANREYKKRKKNGERAPERWIPGTSILIEEIEAL